MEQVTIENDVLAIKVALLGAGVHQFYFPLSVDHMKISI